MNIGIVGSRSFDNYGYMVSVLTPYLKIGIIDLIISGGAAGADSLAKKFAKEHGLKYKEFKAHWNVYGKAAGYKRNVKIVDASEMIIVFWDGSSKGTKHTIDLAKEKGKELVICWPDKFDEIG